MPTKKELNCSKISPDTIKNQPASEISPTTADSTSMATSSKIHKRAYRGNSVFTKANYWHNTSKKRQEERTPTRELLEQNKIQKDTRIHRLGKRKTIPPWTNTDRIWWAQKSTNKKLYIHRKGKKQSDRNMATLEQSTSYKKDGRQGKLKRKKADYKKQPTRTICNRSGTIGAYSGQIRKPRT